ncbi:MAG: ABC transporter permease [Acidobacteriaceae bacterium]
MPTLLRDARYALRQLRKSPGFAITAVLTLALGVGANVVVFSVLNALILKPLNVPHPGNLYNIVRKPQGWDSQSYPDYIDYRDRNSTFRGIAAYNIDEAGISKGSLVSKSFGYEVSGNYFDLLGIQPKLGRFFHAADEHGANSAPYVVLSDNFWRNHFNGNPKIVGDTIELNKHPFTVLGIAPRKFHGTELFMWPDYWVPMVNQQQIEGDSYLHDRGNHVPWLLGRLKPGVTAQQATGNLNTIARQMNKEHPTSDDGLEARLVKPGLMGDALGDPIRAFLVGITVLALLVLLAACANLGSIFAARAADRGRELAIRLAVGSSRWQMLRQLLTESVLVSLLGGIAGTFFATALLHALSRWQPFAEFPVHVPVSPDLRVYTIALLLSLGSGVLFGLLPARQIWRTDAAQVMKSGASTVATFRCFTLRDVLLAVQIALCTLLVTASLVAVRGMQRSLHAPLGIQPQGAMLATADLQMAGYSNEQSLPVQKRMLDQAARIPGVTVVGIINHVPLGTGGGDWDVYRQGTTDFRYSNAVFDAKDFSISPGYLRTAGTQLLAGRDFTWHDDGKSPRVAIVNETFARKMYGNASPIGQPFLSFNKRNLYQIIGVVQDGKYQSLTEDPQPAMFFPVSQGPDSQTTLVVRSHLAPAEMAAALHATLTGIEPSLPFTIQSWPTALGLVLFPAQVAAGALGIMGLLAAMLAVTGIFGMAAYSVSKRMKELGIRIALGAQPVQLMRSALGRPLALLLSGSIAGLVLGMLASRLLAQIVYEATPRDPLVMLGVVVTMALLGLLATWIPARRALHIDPNQLLHEE